MQRKNHNNQLTQTPHYGNSYAHQEMLKPDYIMTQPHGLKMKPLRAIKNHIK